MSYYDLVKSYDDFDFDGFLSEVTDEDVLTVLSKEKLDRYDFLTLLAPAAKNHLEAMAQKARALHLKYQGKSVSLFTPMYIVNYCVNQCMYCSYNHDTDIHRHKMNEEEIRREAEKIRETNLKNILLLTGEDPRN